MPPSFSYLIKNSKTFIVTFLEFLLKIYENKLSTQSAEFQIENLKKV